MSSNFISTDMAHRINEVFTHYTPNLCRADRARVLTTNHVTNEGVRSLFENILKEQPLKLIFKWSRRDWGKVLSIDEFSVSHIRNFTNFNTIPIFINSFELYRIKSDNSLLLVEIRKPHAHGFKNQIHMDRFMQTNINNKSWASCTEINFNDEYFNFYGNNN